MSDKETEGGNVTKRKRRFLPLLFGAIVLTIVYQSGYNSGVRLVQEPDELVIAENNIPSDPAQIISTQNTVARPASAPAQNTAARPANAPAQNTAARPTSAPAQNTAARPTSAPAQNTAVRPANASVQTAGLSPAEQDRVAKELHELHLRAARQEMEEFTQKESLVATASSASVLSPVERFRILEMNKHASAAPVAQPTQATLAPVVPESPTPKPTSGLRPLSPFRIVASSDCDCD